MSKTQDNLKDTVRYVANLARVSLTPAEEELFTSQLKDILEYMRKLNELDTEDIEPMSHTLSLGNVFREDTVRDSLPNDDVLKNAPDKEGSSFKVPKVID